MARKKKEKQWTDEERIELCENEIKEFKGLRAQFLALKEKTSDPQEIAVINQSIKNANITIKLFETVLKEIRIKKPS